MQANLIMKEKSFKKTKRTLTFTDYIVGALLLTILVTFLMSFVMPDTFSARSRTGSNATYEHVMNGTFHNDGSTNKWSTRFENVSSIVLKFVLPLMTVYAITIMVISMSATVIYLSKPDFFDEVDEHHKAVKEMKQQRMGLQKGLAYFQVFSGFGGGASTQNYGSPSFIKGVLIPNFKEIAFHEAAELGKDGRPSLSTFVKHNMPKYMMIMALIIMINDRTLIDLYVAGAEIGVHFTQKLAYDFNYPELIDQALRAGKKYDPGFKGGKQDAYEKMYNLALQADKSEGTESEEYKQTVGALVARTVTDEIGQFVDFENFKTATQARMDTIPFPAGNTPQGTWQFPLSKFGVNTGSSEKYLTVGITMTDKSKRSALVTSEETTYPTAWEFSGDSVTFDLEKTDLRPTREANSDLPPSGAYRAYRIEGRPTVHVLEDTRNRTIRTETPSIGADGKLTINLPNLGGGEAKIAKITFSVKADGGSTRHFRYVNNEAINAELEELDSSTIWNRNEIIPETNLPKNLKKID